MSSKTVFDDVGTTDAVLSTGIVNANMTPRDRAGCVRFQYRLEKVKN